MPIVHLTYKTETPGNTWHKRMAADIATILPRTIAQHINRLEPDWVTVLVGEADETSVNLSNFTVEIPLHHYPDRIEHAEEIAQKIKSDVQKMLDQDGRGDESLKVLLYFGAIAYA